MDGALILAAPSLNILGKYHKNHWNVHNLNNLAMVVPDILTIQNSRLPSCQNDWDSYELLHLSWLVHWSQLILRDWITSRLGSNVKQSIAFLYSCVFSMNMTTSKFIIIIPRKILVPNEGSLYCNLKYNSFIIVSHVWKAQVLELRMHITFQSMQATSFFKVMLNIRLYDPTVSLRHFHTFLKTEKWMEETLPKQIFNWIADCM